MKTVVLYKTIKESRDIRLIFRDMPYEEQNWDRLTNADIIYWLFAGIALVKVDKMEPQWLPANWLIA